MIDITFVTSNQTKLAHARYLCRDSQINILHYKKLYYGVGYEEPRIHDREELLTRSFNDALARWKRNVSGSNDRLFFIEDTSVRIDALCGDKCEVPGVDVKYWMQKTSFDELDNELKSKGNNRHCSVTSHVVLFLTKDLQRRLRTTACYKVFKSTVYGTITDKEYSFETQMLFPWLDNVSFNKWFVPEGSSLPVSMLSITEAESGDFRKGAFEQMISFLADNCELSMESRPEDSIIRFYNSFIICGRTCAGKSTIGKYLAEKYGYYHIEASDFMAQKLLDTHGTGSGIDKHLFASKLLSIEPEYVVNSVIKFMRNHEIFDKYVITGFRTKVEVDAFISGFQIDRIQLIFINSSFHTRYLRWAQRRRDAENYTEVRFKQIDDLQDEMGVGGIAEMNDVIFVENQVNGLPCFFKEFQGKLLHEIKKDPVVFNDGLFKMAKVTLEKAILIVLAIEYRKDNTRVFTTTEISHMINKTFINVEKNKNNVSRYFNQAYYIYYEVSCLNRKKRYKLSSTGYSEAITVINILRKK